MNEIDIDKILTNYGGLYLPSENLPEHAKERIEWAHEKINEVSIFSQTNLGMSGDERVLFWHMLNNQKVGGMCFSSSEGPRTIDFFGINVGSVFVLFDTFARILAHPNTFPSVGNANGENAERAYLPHLSTKRDVAEYSLIEPLDPIRKHYGRWLALTAIEFLAFHEIIHLRNGHVDWLQDSFGIFFDESEEIHAHSPSMMEHQVCEMDADCGAIQWIINRAFEFGKQWNRYSNFQDEEGTMALNHIYESQQSLTQAIVYAIYIMFRLFDTKKYDAKNQHIRKHPQPSVRQLQIQGLIGTLFLTNPSYQMNEEDSTKSFLAATHQAEEDYAAVQQIEMDNSRYISIFTPRNYFHYRMHKWRLHKAWSKIHPKLNSFKRNGNLAPANNPDQIVIPYREDYSFEPF